jgi:hypothetical protein
MVESLKESNSTLLSLPLSMVERTVTSDTDRVGIQWGGNKKYQLLSVLCLSNKIVK